MPRALSTADIQGFRERLIDAAERQFAEHGLEAVTMRQLAGELGVSPMTPYRYFKDKDDILAAVRARAFNRHADAIEAAYARADGPIERANAAGEAYIRFALEHPEAYKLMFDVKQPSANDYPDLIAASQRSKRTMTAHVEDMIRAGYLTGDADLIGHMFWSALHGAIQLELSGMLAPPFDAARLIAATMSTLWQGLRRP
ncbi:MAG: TetR/AcrR family transcriptional regulator [Caulobacterales bacterium]